MTTTRLVFDLDDTLYPERQFAMSGFRAAAAWAREELGIEGLEHEMLALLDAGHLGGLFRVVLERHLGAEAAASHVAPLIESYRCQTPEISLFDDARWLLDRLDGGAPLGLITDGTHQVQASKVAALDLGRRFHTVIYTDALGGKPFFKPHPASFEAMEAALGADGIQFVYIGDNPSKDFVTPNARGWISVQVQRSDADAAGHARIHAKAMPAPGGEAHHIITSLRELPGIIPV